MHGAELLGFAVNNKIALVAQLLDVLAEDARAQRMKGADGGRRRFRRRRRPARRRRGMSLTDALPHFARGLVGESHRQDVARRHALLDQMRDARSDDARLARARPGQNQDRAFGGFDGLPLLRIERGKGGHGRIADCGLRIAD